MRKIDILGVKIDCLRSIEVLAKIQDWLKLNQKKYIVTPNPEFVIRAQKDQEFKNILNQASISIPDGIGLLWAAKFLDLNVKGKKFKTLKIFWQYIYTLLSLIFYPSYCKKIIPERVTGTDLVYRISKFCEQKNCSIYLLGAKEGIAKIAALRLKQQFPNLKIAGTFSGKSESDADQKTLAIIDYARPDILFVAFGAPKQEKWIARNLDKLETVKIAMGVGGAFDFITGKVKRAPIFFQKLGLEWLWRVIHEPWRISRILTATIKFTGKVLQNKIKKTGEKPVKNL
jgi:N-acetylglucosaminyldiphosphoundecaprenol N-acetyl-beta-D-mannosaminyltransferase